MNISCFQTKHHSIDFMAAEFSAAYLATGCGVDVQIWKGDKSRMFLPVLLYIFLTYLYLPQIIGKDRAFWVSRRNLQITAKQKLP